MYVNVGSSCTFLHSLLTCTACRLRWSELDADLWGQAAPNTSYVHIHLVLTNLDVHLLHIDRIVATSLIITAILHYFSMNESIRPFIWLFIYLSIHIYLIYFLTHNLFIYLPICLFVCLFVTVEITFILNYKHVIQFNYIFIHFTPLLCFSHWSSSYIWPMCIIAYLESEFSFLI